MRVNAFFLVGLSGLAGFVHDIISQVINNSICYVYSAHFRAPFQGADRLMQCDVVPWARTRLSPLLPNTL